MAEKPILQQRSYKEFSPLFGINHTISPTNLQLEEAERFVGILTLYF
jgi:hypothetical protein